MWCATSARPDLLADVFPFALDADEVPPPCDPGPPPLLAVYGDSYTTGYLNVGVGESGWAAQVARSLGVSLALNGVGGSGYVSVANHSTFGYAATVWPAPADVVVVFGGFNDREQPPEGVALAARITYRVVRADNPDAPLIVVGPQYPAGTPTANLLAIRDRLSAVARTVGATYVDACRWFTGRRELIGPDGIHPNEAGVRHIADLMRPVIAEALDRS